MTTDIDPGKAADFIALDLSLKQRDGLPEGAGGVYLVVGPVCPVGLLSG